MQDLQKTIEFVQTHKPHLVLPLYFMLSLLNFMRFLEIPGKSIKSQNVT